MSQETPFFATPAPQTTLFGSDSLNNTSSNSGVVDNHQSSSNTGGVSIVSPSLRISQTAPINSVADWETSALHGLLGAHRVARLNNTEVERLQTFLEVNLHPTLEALLAAKGFDFLANGGWKHQTSEDFEKTLLGLIGDQQTITERVRNFEGVIDNSKPGLDAMAIAAFQSKLNGNLNKRGELDNQSPDDMTTSLRHLIDHFFKPYNPPLADLLRQRMQSKKIKSIQDLFKDALKEAIEWQSADAKRNKFLAFDAIITTDANQHRAGEFLDVKSNTIIRVKSTDERSTISSCYGCGRDGHKRERCAFVNHPEFNATGVYPYPQPLSFKRKRDGSVLDNPIIPPESSGHNKKPNNNTKKYGR